MDTISYFIWAKCRWVKVTTNHAVWQATAKANLGTSCKLLAGGLAALIGGSSPAPHAMPTLPVLPPAAVSSGGTYPVPASFYLPARDPDPGMGSSLGSGYGSGGSRIMGGSGLPVDPDPGTGGNLKLAPPTSDPDPSDPPLLTTILDIPPPVAVPVSEPSSMALLLPVVLVMAAFRLWAGRPRDRPS